MEGGPAANDGRPRFDLDVWNPAYFERLRSRVLQAREAGIYVSIMLFQGWTIENRNGKVEPWPFHPYNAANNVNGLGGDLDADGQGDDIHLWQGKEHPVTLRQRAYVRKVIVAVNDLDNVLYEIANESTTGSLPWQNHMVSYIRAVERGMALCHPVGITVPNARERGLNGQLLSGPADWISPNHYAYATFDFRGNPPPCDGTKVVVSDTDHLFGLRCKEPAWVYKTFFRGANLWYMDAWTMERDDPGRRAVREALRHVRRLSLTIDLAHATPMPEVASSGYCLAAPGREYLVYVPGGGSVEVRLAGKETYQGVWHDLAASGHRSDTFVATGPTARLMAPTSSDYALYLSRPEALGD